MNAENVERPSCFLVCIEVVLFACTTLKHADGFFAVHSLAVRSSPAEATFPEADVENAILGPFSVIVWLGDRWSYVSQSIPSQYMD